MGCYAIAPAERLRGYGVRHVFGSMLRILLQALFVNGGVLYRELLILFLEHVSFLFHTPRHVITLGSLDKKHYVGLEYEIWCSESVVPALHQG